jgi:DUF1365 family protein
VSGIGSSAIYRGVVMHKRLRPKPHQLRYDVFYLLLDLGRLEEIAEKSRLLGIGRAAPLSFYSTDHGDGSGDLRAWVVDRLAAAGLEIPLGGVHLLTLPRVFGYVFNPISVFYCYDEAGSLRATIYEVNNTFGQRHAYVLPVQPQDGKIRQACGKKLFVSPFNDMSGGYRFAVLPPGDKVALTIEQSDADGRLLNAAFAGRRHELTDRALFGLLLAYPFLTLKVVAGIHWEALKLWIKGVPLKKRPVHKWPASADTTPGNGTGDGIVPPVTWGNQHEQWSAESGRAR